MEHQGDGDTNVIGRLRMVPKDLEKELEELEIGWWIETIQTSELLRSARILRRVLETKGLSVTQTPVKYHQLNIVWRTHKEWNYNAFDIRRNQNMS